MIAKTTRVTIFDDIEILAKTCTKNVFFHCFYIFIISIHIINIRHDRCLFFFQIIYLTQLLLII